MDLHHKGKMFLRAEVTEEQKETIKLLSDIKGITTQELLGQVVANFVNNNRQLIEKYQNDLKVLVEDVSSNVNMNI
ncbi:hypothetical protein 3S16_1 [uncultured Caudovirales phage]|uniref:Uncharacterized protein n=1 Tax=uncultured Caudovirales phage TaxID=2100421 RepID=A0A2H4JBN4_9CAUD|nr:hypothetical protein 3S16_1 [uncultured Caudovirales phage]